MHERSAAMKRVSTDGRRRALLGAAAAAVLGARIGPAAAAASQTLNIGYTAVADFGAAYIAKERGYFAQRGIDANLQLIALSSNIPAALVSGSLQIGGTTVPLVLQAVHGGLDLVCLATASVYDSSLKAFQVLARNGSGVRSVADLAGRKFAVPGVNATLHLLVRRWMARNGVDWKTVSFVEVPLVQSATVLAGGTVDAMITAEPFVTRILQAGSATVMDGFVEPGPDGAAVAVWTTTREWASKNAAAVQAFRAGLVEAVALATQDRAAARAEIAKYFKLPPALLEAVPFPRLQSTIEDRHLRFWVETMRAQGMLDAQPMVSSIIWK